MRLGDVGFVNMEEISGMGLRGMGFNATFGSCRCCWSREILVVVEGLKGLMGN